MKLEDNRPLSIGFLLMTARYTYSKFLATITQNPWIIQVLSAMSVCKTGVFGYTCKLCLDCGESIIINNGCGNRNCPSCGNIKRAKWAEYMRDKVLPVPHFHLVFTAPHEFNNLFQTYSLKMYNILSNSVSETLISFTNTAKLNNQEELSTKRIPAFTQVLHTWTQTLEAHYHIHVLIANGVFVDKEYQVFKGCTNNYLFPVKALSKVFRGKFLENTKKMLQSLEQPIETITTIGKIETISGKNIPKKWNVYCTKAYNTNNCIKYFAAYVNRVGISNNRLVNYNKDTKEVSFKYKYDSNERDPVTNQKISKRDREGIKTVSLIKFILLYILHILPKGFIKVRHYGLYSSTTKVKIDGIKTTLKDIKSKIKNTIKIVKEKLQDIYNNKKKLICTKCGSERILRIVVRKTILHFDMPEKDDRYD